jgi:hypothetical protein
MENKEITFETNLFSFAESQISNALFMLPEDIDIQYSDPKLHEMNNKLKKVLEESDSSELITTQQAMQIIEPMLVSSGEQVVIMASNIGLMLNELMVFIFNSAMSKLASRNEVDASWDIENNRVEFWVNVVDE